MKFPTIILILFIIAIIILIVLIATRVIKPIPPSETVFQAQIAQAASLQKGFGDPTPVPCPNEQDPNTSLCRGNCLLYETFTIEANVVDHLTPIANVLDPSLPQNFLCLDGHTQALQKVSAQCEQSLCVGKGGDQITSGKSEEFYVKCGELPPCSKSNRSALILNFQTEQGTADFNRQVARCISADIIGQVTFSPETCPNQVNLGDEIFLNINQQPITNSNNTMAQIRAPLTGDCLAVNSSNSVISSPCLSTASEGFNWVYLTSSITVSIIPFITSGSPRIYPQQLILNSTDLLSIEQQIGSITSQISTRLTDLNNQINRLSSSDRRKFLDIINENPQINDFISEGNIAGLTRTAAALGRQSDFKSIFNALGEVLTLYVQLFNEINKINSLQIQNNELVIRPIGGCRDVDINNPTICPFPTQIVPAQQYECGTN